MTVLAVIYLIASFWAAGVVMEKLGIIYVGDVGKYFVSKLFWGILLGWLMIPIAIIIKLINK